MPGGEALFRLSKDDETELRGQVAEQDLPLLKVGQLVDVKLTGMSKVYQGRIRLLGAVIDPATRLGTAKVALTPDPNLRPGAFARAEVTVSNAERSVLPQTAVLSDDKGNYVLIVNAQGKVERRSIHVSGMVPSGVTISGGLDPKDQVVTSARRFLAGGRNSQAASDFCRQVMKNISAWAISKHPVTPIVLFVVLFFMGTVSFIRLPINLNPDVSFPAVNVNISQPGAAPTEMEVQIAQKVEGSISSIGNIHHQQTYISEGNVLIVIEFNIGRPSIGRHHVFATPSREFAPICPRAFSNLRCSVKTMTGGPLRFMR